MKTLLVLLSAVILTWLEIAFVLVEINPFLWDRGARLLMLMAATVKALMLALLVSESDSKPKVVPRMQCPPPPPPPRPDIEPHGQRPDGKP
jgi:hypothetical protein